MNVAAHRVARLCWQQGPHCKHQSIGAQERECVLHNEEGLQSALHPWRRQGYISATGWSGVPQHCVRAGMLAHLRGASVGHIPKAGCHSSCLGHSESPHHTSVSTRPCSLQQQKGKTWGGHHAHDPPSWAHRATQDLIPPARPCCQQPLLGTCPSWGKTDLAVADGRKGRTVHSSSF